MRSSRFFRQSFRLLSLFVIFTLGGCATARPPVKATPGVFVQTLRSEVSVGVSGGGRSGSARGYLVFKRPDRLHVAILSPFGTSLLELFSERDQIVALIPAKMTAYRGTAADLASRGLLAEWSLLQWVLARPPEGAGGSVAEVALAAGGKEKVYFDENGLVQRKVAEGFEVRYGDYREVDGVPFAERVLVTGPGGERITISFSEPEVNRDLEEEVLAPKLEGYQVLPLTAFPTKL